MILEGLSLAIITSGGLYLVYQALPISVRLWMLRHQLITRAGCVVFTYALFGGTLIALFAAGFQDLILGTVLALQSNPHTAAIMAALRDKLVHLRKQLVSLISRGLNQLPLSTTPSPQQQPQLSN